jgi:hypothetical protein
MNPAGRVRCNMSHLFSECGPDNRHVFECALNGRVLYLRRAMFGVVRSLSVLVRSQ